MSDFSSFSAPPSDYQNRARGGPGNPGGPGGSGRGQSRGPGGGQQNGFRPGAGANGSYANANFAGAQNMAPNPLSDNRPPPNNLEAEMALLNAMLFSPQAIADATEAGIKDWHFYSPVHATIFAAITDLDMSGQPVDIITVSNKLRSYSDFKAIEGEKVLLDLQSTSPVIGHASHYARIVVNHALLRKLIDNAHRVIDIGYSQPEDVGRAIDEAEGVFFSASHDRFAQSDEHIGELMEQALERMEMLFNQRSEVTGIPTGYKGYDKLLLGLQPSNLVVVGARPSVGKTSFALGMALNVALKTDHAVLFFSMEMSKLELAQRMVAAAAKVDHTRIRTGQLRKEDWAKITDAMAALKDSKIWIDDSPALTTMEVRAKARRFAHKETLGLIIVDYLQIMTPYGRKSESRAVEVGEMSRDLKILAREIECPVVALSQLSRSLETRTEKRPMLADLRESGSIEQDADVVTFLYRDELYNQESADYGAAEVIVAKHRAGPLGTVKMRFHKEFSYFVDFEDEAWAE